jgi:hypothetical protein
MKKLLTKKEKEKIRKRNNTIIGSILVLIMFFSVIGYSFYTKSLDDSERRERKIVFNGIEFDLKDDGLWHFTVSGTDFISYYSPEELQNMTNELQDIEINLSLNYFNFHDKMLYLHFENEFSTQSEILRNIGNVIQRTNYFCFEKDEYDEFGEFKECEWPIKSCNDTNGIMLITKNAEKNSIKQNENCIFIEFKEQEGLKIASVFVYKLLEIF